MLRSASPARRATAACVVALSAVFSVLVSSGCGRHAAQPGARDPHTEQLAPCPTTPAQGLLSVLEPGNVVILGEMHGTNQVPAFVASAACEAAQRSPVAVGLEVPSAMTPALRAYLASGGTPADREALLADNFWAGQDGRASEAMFGLIDQLRRLTANGHPVDVFGFDVQIANWAGSGSDSRDQGMARNIVSAVTNGPADRITLILTGNLHARVDAEPWMAWHIKRSLPRAISLAVEFYRGSAWACTTTGCGTIDLSPGTNYSQLPFVERKSYRGGQYDGRFYLGTASASQPVRSPGQVPTSSTSGSAHQHVFPADQDRKR